jgi:hypothetical protein
VNDTTHIQLQPTRLPCPSWCNFPPATASTGPADDQDTAPLLRDHETTTGRVDVVKPDEATRSAEWLHRRSDWPIASLRLHADDRDAEGLDFDRECPEFDVVTPGGGRLVVMVNHLKSRWNGAASASDARRQRQAARVAEIYDRLRRDDRAEHVAVLGDFNDTPSSVPLEPLLGNTDLVDVSTRSEFDNGGRPATHGNNAAADRIDYVLLSPELADKMTAGGIHRAGAWGGVNCTLWPHYDTITKRVDAASHHCAVYADINLT